MLHRFFTLFLILFLFLASFQQAISQITIPISAPLDDVEERADGSIYTNSTDLELINDGNDQTVGLRFNNLQIPQGLNITGAWLQFTTDEQTVGACNLEIRAQAIDNAPPFQEIYQNVSSRQLTTASVNWQPSGWNVVGETGPLQRSPNLAAVLQEVIARPGWASGNAVVFIITGTGRRTAGAYEGNPAWAARLVVEIDFPEPTAVLENVLINELMPANGLVKDEFGEVEDWVEIYNGSAEMINLNGLYLTDDASNLKKWKISAPKLIPSGGFGLIWLDGDEHQGGLHAPFQLDDEGEFLALSQELNGQLHVLDAFEFPATPFNISYGRLEDGLDEWVFFGEISPEASNNGKGRFLDSKVIFSKPGGFYQGPQSLELSVSDPGATIFYTLDGSTPNPDDEEYTGPVTVSQTAIVRAAAFKPGFARSQVSTENYFISPTPSTLPVVCVQTEPENLWDNQTGIYVSGTNGIPGYCSDEPRNWNQDWERPANITFFEANGTKGFQVNAGIKIGGGCSRGYKMKSMNIYMRSNTYGDESIDYQVFPGLDIHQFKRLKLRNSGNDFDQMMFRDGMNQTLLYNTVDLDLMAYRPVVVYLNGEYWGVYGLRELYNEDYVASHHGVDPKNLDIITNPQAWAEVNEGDFTAFQTIKNFIQNNNLSLPGNYEFLKSRMDMSQYINYNIAQIYLANYDWPANNVRVWRDRNGGKFRWMLYDTDLSTNYGSWTPATSSFNSIHHATTTGGNPWPNSPESTLFLRKLLQNEEFKSEFVQRTATYRKLIFAAQRVHPMVDSLRQMLEPEMPRHISRWNANHPQWGWGVPSGGNISSWNFFVNYYKTFFENRSQQILGHYTATLSLSGTYMLSFVYPQNTPGDLYLHSNDIKIPFNYAGDYFKNVPLKVTAVAKPGYRFVKWLETGETSPEIDFISNQHTTLTPIFIPAAPILTEIHYQPEEGEAYEFLELYNATNEDLAIGGYYFSNSIEFEFPAGTVLPPNEYLIVAKDKSKYGELGCQVFEWTSGELEDSGELIELTDDQGLIIESVNYSAATPWVQEPAGGGSSLSLISPFFNNSIPQNWEASVFHGGTPCGEKSPVSGNTERAFLLSLYPNPVRENLIFEYSTLTDESIDLEVFNTLGQAVRSIELPPAVYLEKTVIPVSDWPAGMYFIRMKGDKKAMLKFLKS